MTTNILVIPGSNRVRSHNRRLAQEATRMLALTDAIVTLLDLSDYPLPIYDGDHEAEVGVPQNAVLLAQRIALSDGLLLASPEYNASVSPLLKNAIDWASRARKVKGRPVQPFKRLVVGLASASSGRNGGRQGLETLRAIMRSLGSEVITDQCTVANAATAFDENGRLAEDDARTSLEALVDRLLDTSRVLGRNG